MEALAQSRPGLFLKKTDHMWMIHYSRVPENEHAAVEAALRAPLAGLVREINAQGVGPPLLLANEDQMFQLRPEGSDKGPAVANIMQHPHAGADHKLTPICSRRPSRRHRRGPGRAGAGRDFCFCRRRPGCQRGGGFSPARHGGGTRAVREGGRDGKAGEAVPQPSRFQF